MTGDEHENSMAGVSAGQQLRQAREKAGLSVAVVAEQQHLRPSIIQAIESGDYGKVDTELFLKGYVRAYARQVGLDADALIRQLDVELEPRRQEREQALQSHPLVDIERKKRRKRRIAKIILNLVALVIVVGLIVIYFNRDESSTPVPESPAGQGQTSQGDTLIASAPVPAPEPEEEPAVDPVDEPLPAPVAEGPVGQQDAGDPETVQEPEVQGDEPQVPVAESPARLRITFNSDCWVRITDSTGNRLANGLSRRGDQLDVSGATPFTVVIGAMSAVETIEFRGEPLDPTRFRVVNNRAEFTLEP
ncbi:MAG TPA: RodZ domain-containing protein [Marinobacter sp.]|nr:RodZ domain-containing protein [Marinobacter sp.]